MTALLIRDATVLLEDGPVRADVRVEDGCIAAIGTPSAAGARVIDARNHLLAPAFVDIHGDAFERQLEPRPGVRVDTATALLETDRQLAANGIATAYHALTLSWEPGLRSLAMAGEVMDTLALLAPRLSVEHRIQLRWETFAVEALPLIRRALEGPLTPAIAFNDHTTMALRPIGMAVADRPDPMLAIASPDDPALAARLAKSAARSGLSARDYIDLLKARWARRGETDALIADVAGQGRRVGAPMLSHDDCQPVTRERFSGLGVRIAEFPMTRETADAARAAGDAVVLGAPNVMRGGSHNGAVDAAGMISAGLCDILASDYYYPAMLAATARLAGPLEMPLQQAWACVAAAPARALGLTDRGCIAPGLRADLVLVDWPAIPSGPPAIRLTLRAGRIASLADSALAPA
ncbi:alpha-D-ribose 1-methylphosphonate 5-triphosphate diphosphatase (plasmid) [Paroceanicella profunda]|uniref:Alpha-D-ribose 1-methylphosphonate 5-triphosphate diphosphatase n=1 Tax=Paroceanicella profunda TaxID=2579971 RepID=A0A5B8FIV2_9RHOB|nr:alpha-D-ribose 1-methylphosphonate 5-triphosphate diphosphatase [Paroceanicella profunda]QDL94231.1 alpha-D-ribose 1-methylphosphonate 5-triphosphate diphosphatase [Paroceanicella profunda]